MVLDAENPHASSRIAAGIIHPVTGRRIVKTWMADTLIPFAEKFYTEIENYFKVRLFHPLRIVELLSSAKEYNDWMARSNEQGLDAYIDPSFDADAYNHFLHPYYKKILIKKSAWIDTSLLLDKFKKYFSDIDSFRKEKFEVENKYNIANTSKDKTSGIGLVNVSRRLQLLYGKEHALSVTTNDGVYKVFLQLKLK